MCFVKNGAISFLTDSAVSAEIAAANNCGSSVFIVVAEVEAKMEDLFRFFGRGSQPVFEELGSGVVVLKRGERRHGAAELVCCMLVAPLVTRVESTGLNEKQFCLLSENSVSVRS